MRMTLDEFKKRTAGGFLASQEVDRSKRHKTTAVVKKTAQSALKQPSALESKFLFQLRALNIPEPTLEYHFHPSRKWRYDFAFVDYRVAVELEGGTWTHGRLVDGKKQISRHLTGKGFYNDCRKYNAAAALGWLVIRADARMVKTGEAIGDLLEVLRLRGYDDIK